MIVYIKPTSLVGQGQVTGDFSSLDSGALYGGVGPGFGGEMIVLWTRRYAVPPLGITVSGLSR